MACAAPETVDRVVASIDNQAITLSDVGAEYRLELLLQGKFPAPAPDPAALARVCNRIIEQKLLAAEAGDDAGDADDPPRPPPETLDGLRKHFPSAEAFQSALDTLGLDEQQITERLRRQEKTLEIIDRRFRPSAWPDVADIETYYRETFLPEYVRQHRDAPPPLTSVADQIRELLVQRNINRLLDEWLTEMKSSHRVKIHGF